MVIMVRRIVIQILFMLLCTAVPVLAQDCYKFTRTQAISYYEKGEYRIARDQFIAAKDCPDKPVDNDLDSWIARCDSAIAEIGRKAEAERQRRIEEERIKAEERKREEQARIAEEKRLAEEKKREEERRQQEIRDSIARYSLTETQMVLYPFGVLTGKTETLTIADVLSGLESVFAGNVSEYQGSVSLYGISPYFYKGFSDKIIAGCYFSEGKFSQHSYRLTFLKSEYSQKEVLDMANEFAAALTAAGAEMSVVEPIGTETLRIEGEFAGKMIWIDSSECSHVQKFDSWYFEVTCFQ